MVSRYTMFVLSLVSSKGGSGKSTLAACIAAVAVEAGRPVYVVDTDEQGSLAAWSDRRTKAGTHDIVHHSIQPSALAAQLTAIRKFSPDAFVVVDSAGVAGTGGAIAAGASDLVLVPVRPTRTDLDAVRPTVERLQLIGARWAFVVVQVPGGARDRAREAARALVKLGRVAPAFTGSRVSYTDALADGTGITEADPRGKGAEEIMALWAWIEQQMEDARGGA